MSRTDWTTLKTAAFAAMQIASVRKAAALKPLSLMSERAAKARP